MRKKLISQYIDEEDLIEYEKAERVLEPEMDERCILGLSCLPDDICHAAVRRLRAIKSAGRPLTEEEEAVLPGCPWAIQHQKSNYCFFKYMKDYMGESSPSDQEIAHMLKCSQQDVSKSFKSSLNKVKNSDFIDNLKSNISDEEIIDSQEISPSYEILK